MCLRVRARAASVISTNRNTNTHTRARTRHLVSEHRSLNPAVLLLFTRLQVEPYTGNKDVTGWIVVWRIGSAFSATLCFALMTLGQQVVSTLEDSKVAHVISSKFEY